MRILKPWMKNSKNIVRLVVLGAFLVSTIGSTVDVFAKYNEDSYSSNEVLFYDPRKPICSSDASSVTKLAGSDNREKIWNYLKAKGLSPEQAAGVLGNIQSESAGSFSPTVNEYGKTFGDGGYGIVQWTDGRRTNVVTYLNKQVPDVMTQYYNASYSTEGSTTSATQGFIPKNNSTGVPMDKNANDEMLLNELDFLYSESTSRNLHSPAVAKGYGASSDNEWETIKKQSTIADASNVWVYSYEIPDNIDATAAVRAANGQKIYDLYKNLDGSSSSSCALTGSADKVTLAKAIIANPNITYEKSTDATKGAKQIFQNIADGTNDGNSFPCGVNVKIMQIIDAIGKDHTIRINSMNRACVNSTAGGASTSSSRHFAGNGSAVDLGPIDGKASYKSEGANLIISIVNPFFVPSSGVGQSGCSGLANLPVAKGVVRFTDTCSHLHIDFPPNADPGLKCKIPVYSGGCDASQRV